MSGLGGGFGKFGGDLAQTGKEAFQEFHNPSTPSDTAALEQAIEGGLGGLAPAEQAPTSQVPYQPQRGEVGGSLARSKLAEQLGQAIAEVIEQVKKFFDPDYGEIDLGSGPSDPVVISDPPDIFGGDDFNFDPDFDWSDIFGDGSDFDLPGPDVDQTGPGVPPPTPPPGRDVDAVVNKITAQLAHEYDGALGKTLKDFADKTNRGNASELDALVKGLAGKGKLDDLAVELGVAARDRKIRKLPDPGFTFAQLDAKIKKFGSAETKALWAKACASLNKKTGTPGVDGRATGKEIYNEIGVALNEKRRPLLEANVRELIRTFPGKKGSAQQLKYATAKLNTAIQKLADEGKLDELMREMNGSAHGKRLLTQLRAKINQYGSKAVKQIWNGYAGRKYPPATIPAPGRKPKPPGAKGPAAARPSTKPAKPGVRPGATKPAAGRPGAGKPATKPKPPATTKPAKRPSEAGGIDKGPRPAPTAQTKPKPAPAPAAQTRPAPAPTAQAGVKKKR